MEYNGHYDVVGVRLPNGLIKVIKNSNGTVGDIITESTFMERYGRVNEGVSLSYRILDLING